MTKVLLGLGLLLVVAVSLVIGAVIYATWLDDSRPNMTKEDVKAVVITHVLTQLSPASPAFLACEKGSSEESVRYTGEGTWIVKFGSCAVTVDDRTGKVSP